MHPFHGCVSCREGNFQKYTFSISFLHMIHMMPRHHAINCCDGKCAEADKIHKMIEEEIKSYISSDFVYYLRRSRIFLIGNICCG